MPNPPQATSLLPTGDGGSSKAASRGRREHGAETNQQDRTHSAKPKRQKTKRSGKWTKAEEHYARCLINYYAAGFFELPRGQTLRLFIATKLRCSSMRVTKKFPGTGSVMKQAVSSSPIKNNTSQPTDAVFAHDYLTSQEEAFLSSIKFSGGSTSSSAAGQSTQESKETSTTPSAQRISPMAKTPNRTLRGALVMAPLSDPVASQLPATHPPALPDFCHLNIAALVNRAASLQNTITTLNMAAAAAAAPIIHNTLVPSIQQIQSMIIQNVLVQLQVKHKAEQQLQQQQLQQQQQAMVAILNQLLSNPASNAPLPATSLRQVEGAADFINFLTSVRKANWSTPTGP